MGKRQDTSWITELAKRRTPSRKVAIIDFSIDEILFEIGSVDQLWSRINYVGNYFNGLLLYASAKQVFCENATDAKMQNGQWNYENSEMTISTPQDMGVSLPTRVKRNSIANDEIDQALNDVVMTVQEVENCVEIGREADQARGGDESDDKDEEGSSKNELVLLPGGNITN